MRMIFDLLCYIIQTAMKTVMIDNTWWMLMSMFTVHYGHGLNEGMKHYYDKEHVLHFTSYVSLEDNAFLRHVSETYL